MKKRLRSSSLFEKKRLLSVLVLLFAFLTLKAQTTLSTSPTLIFNTTEATVIGTIATDGSGGSVNISDLDLQIFAGTKANGTLLPNQNVEYHNNAWFASSNSFFGITPNSANIEAEGYQALIIKSSSQANNFSLKSLQLYDWGGNTPVILEAYDGGVSKGTVEIAFVNGVAKTLTQSDLLSSTALQSIDEVRIYGKNNLGIWMSVNNIQVAPPVAPDITPPTVTSINRVGTTPTNASSVIYTVIFSESVTGVTTDDFALTTSGSASGTIASITGSGTTYTVTVNNTGDGTLKLDLNSSGTGIKDLANNLITTGYTTGQLFTIDRTPPETTITSFPPAATTSNSFTFMYSSSESPATYQAKEDISPVYASGNNFYPMRNLPAGNHTFSVAAVDAAGNIDPTPATYTWKVQAIPRLTASSGSTIFTEGNNTISIPVAIDAAMTLNNPDNVQLISTTVQIAVNLDATQDILTFVNNGVTMGNIVSDPYNTATGTIILRSTTATSADWLAAIRSITYTNSSETPGIGNRTISFLISDGINTIPGVNKIVNVVSVNDAPIVTASSGTTVFVQTNVIVDNGITISDTDNTTLASANIRILTGQPQDVLSFINNDATLYGNITGNYIGPTRSMNLASSGNTATIAQWQAVLRAITFSTTSINTSNRVVTFFVNDGAVNSNSTTKTLTITVPISISPATLPAASAGATYNQTLSATGNTAPYSFAITNGTLPAGLTLHASGLLSGTPTETGTFSITITATSATSFTGSKAYSFVINPGVQTITMNTVATATYGNADIDPGATATSLLPVTYTSGDLNIATIINNKIHILKAGTVTINANQPGNGTFSAAAQVQQVLTVLPAPLTITADSYSKIYGAALPALTYSMTGFVNGDTFASLTTQPTLNTTAVRGSSVAGGPYAITPGGAIAANYTISYIPGNLTVTPAALIITATNKSKLYGAALPALNVTLRGVVNNDTFESLTAQLTLSTTATAASSVAGSPYVITPRGAIATNYTISYVSGNLTVIPAALTITAGSKNKIYGAALPALTYSATGFVNGDTFASLTTQPVLSTTATAASSVAGSPYVITPSGAVSANYSINYVPGNLTVDPAALTITADNQTKGYGAALPILTASASGFVNGDTFASLTTQPVLSTTATAASSVTGSPYAITANGAVSTNYAVNYAPGVLTVTPAILTITADDKERFQNFPNPALTVSYAGFVNNETPAVLNRQPVISTTATLNSSAGNYPTTAANAFALNYSIRYIDGVLKVKAGIPTNITLTEATLYENSPAGINAGTLNSTSDDLLATFTYTLVTGSGSTDNSLFTINGNQLNTTQPLDYENKSVYKIRVKTTTQNNLSLEKELVVNLTDVNEAPTLAAIADQTICYTSATQSFGITGITSGPETNQNTSLTISSNNASLFSNLSVNGSRSTGTISYKVKNGASGSAMVTITVKDNGGTANGGTDTYSRTFNITVNPMPVITITSSLAGQLSKGQTTLLTARGGLSYSWANSAGIISGQNSAVLTVRPAQTTTYTVTATNISGCQDSQSYTVNVMDDLVTIKATNIMTPNGDGINDKWIIDNIDFHPNNEVKIYDKAGRLLYNKKGYDNSWDATLNGVPLNEGTYFYIIDFGPEKRVFKGYITIVRNQQ